MDFLKATKAAIKNNSAMANAKMRKMGVAVSPEKDYDENYFAVIDTRKREYIGRRWAPTTHDILSKKWALAKGVNGMDFLKATEAAIKNNSYMTRPILSKKRIAIMPEQHGNVKSFIKIEINTKTPIGKWAPKVNDIIAKDWIIGKE